MHIHKIYTLLAMAMAVMAAPLPVPEAHPEPKNFGSYSPYASYGKKVEISSLHVEKLTQFLGKYGTTFSSC
jgi:hypothetical protein